MLIAPRIAATQYTSWAPCGSIWTFTRIRAYPPSFRRTPARITDPPVGASTWASGSHVWRGHVGSFVANPARRAMNRRFWTVPAGTSAPVRASSISRVMLNVWPYP